MRLLVTGALGNVGRKIMAAFPGSLGLDQVPGTDITADLATIDYNVPAIRQILAEVDGLVHLATSPDPAADDAIHWQAVANAARLLQAAQGHHIARVVLASSDWAQPKTDAIAVNTYGHSKRVFEAMAAMYAHSTGHAIALRIGWVPRDPAAVLTAEPWLQAKLLA